MKTLATSKSPSTNISSFEQWLLSEGIQACIPGFASNNSNSFKFGDNQAAGALYGVDSYKKLLLAYFVPDCDIKSISKKTGLTSSTRSATDNNSHGHTDHLQSLQTGGDTLGTEESCESSYDPCLEILINGQDTLTWVGRQSINHHPSPFSTNKAMTRWLQDFAWEQGLRLDPYEPSAGGLMELPQTFLQQHPEFESSSFRWHGVLAPLAQDGPQLCLRRHQFTELDLADFFLSDRHRQMLLDAVQNSLPILFVGPTGSGKTSLMQALLKARCRTERVIILETIAELPRLSPRWVRLLARGSDHQNKGAIDLDRLLQESLRLRPDRFVVGELRSSEAAAFCQAVRTGHGAAMATLHGGSVDDVPDRLASLGVGSKALPRSTTVVQMARGRIPKVETITHLGNILS